LIAHILDFVSSKRAYNSGMRRPLSIAAFVLLLALAPALAQRGGGHGSVGGHGAGVAAHGSFAGHASGGHAFGGMHSSPGMGSRGFGRSPAISRPSFSSRNSFRNFNRFRGPFISNSFRARRFERGRFGRGWPWWGGYYDPWWWDSDSYSSYDPDYERQLEIAQEMNAQSLEEKRARQGQEDDQDLYARSAPLPQQQAERMEASPATVLVFRDQRTQEVQNYAIVGQTLWNFARQRTQKIPLADLDLAATTKANDDRGINFHVPGVSEAQ